MQSNHILSIQEIKQRRGIEIQAPQFAAVTIDADIIFTEAHR